MAIDDNSFNLYVIEQILKNNYKIRTFLSGVEAIEHLSMEIKKEKIKCDLCNKSNYSVIFMDLDMPVKDGFLTTKEILSLYKQNNIIPPNIIACTAFVGEE